MQNIFKIKLVIQCFIIAILGLFSGFLMAQKPAEDIISKSIFVESKVESVWSALTEEDELGKWWNKGVILEPQVGGIFYEPWGWAG